jgi:hypothetical protein
MRSPLAEVQLPAAGTPSSQPKTGAEVDSPAARRMSGSHRILSQSLSGTPPVAEACLSPTVHPAVVPGRPADPHQRAGQKLPRRGLKNAHTPTVAAAAAAAFAAENMHLQKVPEMDASLCNIQGSPLSPMDAAAPQHCGHQAAIGCRPASNTMFQSAQEWHNEAEALRSTAASPFVGDSAQSSLYVSQIHGGSCANGPSFTAGLPKPSGAAATAIEGHPAGGEAAGRHQHQHGGSAQRALDTERDPVVVVEVPSPRVSPGEAVTPTISAARVKVPALRLSDSVRISVEATTPPCSFPLRGAAAGFGRAEARPANSPSARTTLSDTSVEFDVQVACRHDCLSSELPAILVPVLVVLSC